MKTYRLPQVTSIQRDMGFVTRIWPDAGIPPVLVNGITFYVRRKNPKGELRHRAMAMCPICFEHVPASRFNQHVESARCLRLASSHGGV